MINPNFTFWLLVALLFAVVMLLLELRKLNRTIERRGNQAPLSGPPAKTTREESREAILAHEEQFHRRRS